MLAACGTGGRAADDAREQRVVETNVQLAVGYMQRGQLDVAKEKLDKALAADPDSSAANNAMGLLMWQFKNYPEAERYLRNAANKGAETPDAQNNYGSFLCDRGRIDEAEIWFQKAVVNPLYRTRATAYENAGLCQMKKPAPKAAEKYFREALALNPKLPQSLYNMARISFDLGRALAARGFIQRYFQEATDTPEALLLAVKIERALHNRNEEASYALRLRGKFPESPEAKVLKQGLLDERG